MAIRSAGDNCRENYCARLCYRAFVVSCWIWRSLRLFLLLSSAWKVHSQVFKWASSTPSSTSYSYIYICNIVDCIYVRSSRAPANQIIYIYIFDAANSMHGVDGSSSHFIYTFQIRIFRCRFACSPATLQNNNELRHCTCLMSCFKFGSVFEDH